MTVAGGRPRTVPHTGDGAFLAVLRGYPEDAQPVVRVERADGSARTFASSSDDGFIVADPYGGRAWKLSVFGFGTRPAEAPRLRTGVRELRHRACRAGRAERQLDAGVRASSPNRPGVKLKSLFFATRRLSGVRPVDQLPGRRLARPRGAGRGLRRRPRREADRRPRRHAAAAGQAAAQRRLPRLPAALDAARAPCACRSTASRYGPTLRHGHAAQAGARLGGRVRGDGPGRPGRARAPGRRPLRAGLGPVPRHDVEARRDARRSRGRAPVGAASSSTPTASSSRSRRARSPGRSGSGAAAASSSAACAARRSAGSTVTGSSGAAGTEYPLLQCTALKRQAPVGELVLDARPRRPGRAERHRLGRLGLPPRRQGGDGRRQRRAPTARRRSPTARSCASAGADARPRRARASAAAGGRSRLGAARAAVRDHARASRSRRWSRAPRRSRRPRPTRRAARTAAMQVAQTQEGVPCAVGPARVVGDRGGERRPAARAVHRAAR